MAEIVLDKVTKLYPDGAKAVSDVDITIADGEFIILVGPSGCGKSTTLNMIAGLEDISTGELRIAGERVNERAPKDRDIAMVFQSYALYPHMTVRDNLAFGLRMQRTEQAVIDQRVAAAAVHGSWAEYFIAPAQGVVPLNDAIDDETAAQLIGMPISALMLLDFVNLQPGQWLIQNTANGAVGKTVAMIAQARGQQVINLVRRSSAVAELQALGIQHVVAADQADWREQVKALHGGQPLMAGVDSIGGAASGELLALLSENGLLVSFGSMSGEAMQIASGDLIFKQATVKGFWASAVNKQLPAERKKALIVELLTLAAQKKLALPVEGVFSFEQIHSAALKAVEGARQGKVLLKP